MKCELFWVRVYLCKNNTKYLLFPHLPQVADTNSPRLMDAAGESLLYDEYIRQFGEM